ncbi:hypothetical protein ALQ33_200030 [Pseudomonas syringae pv. philadelphi]|uniref:Uncharacterized protein n=1 Tax=Pseudomonas syringae pv. philadelphi TaxID=251706 RepID=A0A3M3YDX1_9PSED|nr:hypothetical protein [Pseudomonas syringae group genomosp. 3]RMO79773.1 hypothetical protein ALQ33_200030 [Pseudomonas syringae pv. philadelphi]
MIGDDDFETFFDPDEFGEKAQIIEPGAAPRDVVGIPGKPAGSDGIYRGGIDPNAANLRAVPLQQNIQIPARDLPKEWKLVKVQYRGSLWSIGNVEPLGRLRKLLTLVPYGDRAAPAGERGKWQASN